MSSFHYRICLKAFTVLLTLLWPYLVLAVMPPWVYENARKTALHHVQAKVFSVRSPSKTPGECQVIAAVVRIFRDKTGRLARGTKLEFTVSCARVGDPKLVGGTLWTDYDSLTKAKYLEVFLNSDETGYRVALWQSRIIDQPTQKPAWP